MSDASGAEENEAAEALVGTTVAERYRIDALLGMGGMGAVYKATHVHMQRTVALKLLHPEMANVPEVLARFEREAVAAASVTHPNLASALDFGKLPGDSFYLVMEFVPGELLRDALSAGPMAPERVVKIGMQIAAALEAAHAAGIVHRDLKPENVILRASGAEEQVKVLDLGIAKVPVEDGGGKTLTRVGAVLGTPQYMSPEQGIGAKIDHRSDLYALGVVLYEMASGKPPFADDGSPHAVIARHLTEPPPALPPTVPAPLAALIGDLLQKSAAARPQSATEVIERLGQALPEAPAAAAAAPAAMPAAVPPTRSRRLALAAGALALVGLGAWLAKTLASSNLAPEPAASSQGKARLERAAAPAEPPVTRAPAATRAEPAASQRSVPPAASVTARPRDEGARKPARPKPAKSKPKKEQRKTGPGGIYIPPPEDWF